VSGIRNEYFIYSKITFAYSGSTTLYLGGRLYPPLEPPHHSGAASSISPTAGLYSSTTPTAGLYSSTTPTGGLYQHTHSPSLEMFSQQQQQRLLPTSPYQGGGGGFAAAQHGGSGSILLSSHHQLGYYKLPDEVY
jgi:hypothetical protein